VLAVSHDRHFLEKVVDGLLIFEGNGEISGFPGSYSDYYDWKKEQQKMEQQALRAAEPKAKPKAKSDSKPRKLSFAERKEMEKLSNEIESLENEKAEIETAINSGTLPHDELIGQSNRIAELLHLLDTKGERWLELMEIDENAG
jgi:ATP-binding cassette subfamily F protein uup